MRAQKVKKAERKPGWLLLNIKKLRSKTTFSEKLELIGTFIGILTLLLVGWQLRENTKTNQVSIRGQLYQSEAGMAETEASDKEQNLTTIWALVPSNIEGEEFRKTLLQLVTKDPTALKAKTAEELYHSMFDAEVFADPTRRDSTAELRKLFLYTQTNFYHVHCALDYKKDKILTEMEWTTWKNLIREMNAHPILITVIWQGHRNHYFSRSFGEFLQSQLCGDSLPLNDFDPQGYKRGKNFVRTFYPEMSQKKWLQSLPDY